jgi:uncharacterized protein YjbI with pentapeptide repeats
MSVRCENSSKTGIKCFNVTKLILIALPSIAFGIFTIIFTLQQDNFAKMNQNQNQHQSDEQNTRVTFESYIDDISTLLLKKSFNRSDDKYLLYIRVKTLATLRHVDATRKRDIILFLYESRLLRTDVPKTQRLDLAGADLSDTQFIGSLPSPLVLNYLYLSGVKATNIVFHWCQLRNAVFDYSSMPNIKLIKVSITNASFRQVYAPDGTMQHVVFCRNHFFGSVIVRMHYISNVYLKDPTNFTNTDLLNNFLTFDDRPTDLTQHLIDPFIIIKNARLPDGSFHYIDSSDLVIDGGAEQGVCEI